MDMNINRLPSPTWNWLRMNRAAVEGVETINTGRNTRAVPAAVHYAEEKVSPLAGTETALGSDMDALIRESGVPYQVFRTDEASAVEEPVRLSFVYEDGASDANAVDLVCEAGSSMTVLMDLRAEASAGGTAALQTKYVVEDGASLTIVQTVIGGSSFRLLNDIGGICREGSRCRVIQLLLSGHETYMGCYTALKGDSSDFKADIGYLGRNDEKIDMNYIANHNGKKSTCSMKASGVLRDRAQKLFRGTIDLRRGAAESEGVEKEDVFLMDEGVVNRTVPVILCTEEDVFGSHGATIGRLDDDTVFYMGSRGLSKEEVYEMMARARLETVVAMIPDRSARKAAADWLDRQLKA